MSFAVSRGSFKALAGRTLFLKVVPTPRTLTERRAILRSLDKFGQVSMFKRMEQQPDNFICLMAANETATHAVSNSPIKVSISNMALPLNDYMIHNWTSSTSSGQLTFMTDIETKIAEERLADMYKAPYNPFRPSFLVHIFPGNKFSHKKNLQISPFHGSWAAYDRNRAASYISADLAEHIPPGISAEGLKTWDPESLHYTHNELFCFRRVARKNHSYTGAVPALMTNRTKTVKEAGLLGQGRDKHPKTTIDAPILKKGGPKEVGSATSSDDFYAAFGRKRYLGNPQASKLKTTR